MPRFGMRQDRRVGLDLGLPTNVDQCTTRHAMGTAAHVCVCMYVCVVYSTHVMACGYDGHQRLSSGHPHPFLILRTVICLL